jgi:hypothetical protein
MKVWFILKKHTFFHGSRWLMAVLPSLKSYFIFEKKTTFTCIYQKKVVTLYRNKRKSNKGREDLHKGVKKQGGKPRRLSYREPAAKHQRDDGEREDCRRQN